GAHPAPRLRPHPADRAPTIAVRRSPPCESLGTPSASLRASPARTAMLPPPRRAGPASSVDVPACLVQLSSARLAAQAVHRHTLSKPSRVPRRLPSANTLPPSGPCSGPSAYPGDRRLGRRILATPCRVACSNNPRPGELHQPPRYPTREEAPKARRSSGGPPSPADTTTSALAPSPPPPRLDLARSAGLS